MDIKNIYQEFGIPPNLQEHMFRVWGVVSFIEIHWNNSQIKVDWDLVKQASLLHDLGNVVRFDFNKHPEFLGKEQINVEYWKDIQKKVIENYGSDDHIATEKMLMEMGVSQEMIEIIGKKSFGNSVAIKNGNNWPLKILSYADLRTLPWGIGTLEERIADIKERMPKYTSRPDFNDLIEACRRVERQIQENLNVPVSEINNDTIVSKKCAGV